MCTKSCNEYAMLPCILAYLHVPLGCRSMSVLFVVLLCCCVVEFNNHARYLCLICAHVLKLAALLVPPLVCIAA